MTSVQAQSFDEAVWRYGRMYSRGALSSSPRTEIIFAAVGVGLFAGLLWSLFLRSNQQNGEMCWLAICFCAVMIWHLGFAAIIQPFVIDELLYRGSRMIGHPIGSIGEISGLQRFVRVDGALVISIGEIMLIGWAVSAAMDWYWPQLRIVTFTGGG